MRRSESENLGAERIPDHLASYRRDIVMKARRDARAVLAGYPNKKIEFNRADLSYRISDEDIAKLASEALGEMDVSDRFKAELYESYRKAFKEALDKEHPNFKNVQ